MLTCNSDLEKSLPSSIFSSETASMNRSMKSAGSPGSIPLLESSSYGHEELKNDVNENPTRCFSLEWTASVAISNIFDPDRPKNLANLRKVHLMTGRAGGIRWPNKKGGQRILLINKLETKLTKGLLKKRVVLWPRAILQIISIVNSW